MLPFKFDPRIKRRYRRIPLQITVDEDTGLIIWSRARHRQIFMSDFVRELIGDSLRHLVESEFLTRGFDPSSENPWAVEAAYRGCYDARYPNKPLLGTDMFKFEFDPRIVRSLGPVPLKLAIPSDLYDIMSYRANERGISIGAFALELIEDALRIVVDEEFIELEFDPKSEAPDTVMYAYMGRYEPMTVGELSARTGLSQSLLVELASAGKVPGSIGTGCYARQLVVPWIRSDEPRRHYQANPRRRAKNRKQP